jgi:hypothetical protein
VLPPQLGHEPLPKRRSACLHEPGADAERLGHREPATAPGTNLGDHRHEGDRLLRQAVDRLLLVIGIAAAREQACLDERAEPIGQDVGGDAG